MPDQQQSVEPMRLPDVHLEHDWHLCDNGRWTVCRRCGIIQRRDGQNKSCPGVVRVTLRDDQPYRGPITDTTGDVTKGDF